MYQTIPSLTEYVLISQDEPNVEIFWKQDEQHWLYQTIQSLEKDVPLQSIEHTIPMQLIYQKAPLNSLK